MRRQSSYWLTGLRDAAVICSGDALDNKHLATDLPMRAENRTFPWSKKEPFTIWMNKQDYDHIVSANCEKVLLIW